MSRSRKQHTIWLVLGQEPEEGAHKEAAFDAKKVLTAKGLTNLGIGMGAAAALGGGLVLGAKGLDTAADSISDPIKHTVYRKRMLKAYPELGEKHDATEVKRFFKTLYKFSPKTASDPVAAAAWMRRNLEYKDIGPQTADLKGLAEIDRNIRQTERDGVGSMVLGQSGLRDAHGLLSRS